MRRLPYGPGLHEQQAHLGKWVDSTKRSPVSSGHGLQTRKGTGLYKIPSLHGLWYRIYLSHDASVASLEEWFDAARLRDDYMPKGFLGYQVQHRAVPGHELGLKLGGEDKTPLIAFLRTL